MDDFLKVTSTRAKDLAPEPFPSELVDPFGRAVDYIRISVTDRCDFRCVYCMAEEMTFLPKERSADIRRVGTSLPDIYVDGHP